ncbi:MAG: diguanylate cyclase [Clostridiales bacterium]|nr:diguanylate cyclase [Clostridiales bacterium]
MQNALYVEISAVGIILLSVILVTQRQTIGSSAAQRRFNSLIYATMFMLVVDACCWLIDGQQFRFARALNYAVETLYYILHVLLPYLWALYVEGALSTDMKAARRRIAIATVPLVLFILVLAFNIHYEFVFRIDAENVYHRAWGVYFYAFFTYAYLIYASIRALIKAQGASWVDDRRRYYTMAFFAVPPSIGGLLQLFYYGLSLNWILAAVSILLVYIDSQNRQISTDPLTGLNNRRELSKFLLRETRERELPKSGVLILLMMDVDGFKQINDSCGHFYGDNILTAVAGILKASCKNTEAFLARYGGDEFCIVLPNENGNDAAELIARIQMNVADWNASNREMKPIGLSIGYATWDAQNDATFESLITRADQKMYEAKNAKKLC